ncbi:tetratricopeptide repeat protein [Stenotrophomonas sp.]|uniref:tetratricopeptide repeat protein n=1 Tax=Stenotrophomonas sp. TaxID=69392 RepID=UPI002FCBEE27
MQDPANRPTASQFMRALRPELYSDSASRIRYCLNAEILSHHLETITERNQTHDFELFCRKLCERSICPNLRPATGPEGGGDSKADTETTPVAEEIRKLTYVGAANSGSERWAFAFSAKKKWAEKVRSDVTGIAATDRGYTRIIFVTSRAARAKDRAALEDALSKQHGIPVTIHDRSWIVAEVIEKDRRDLAFHYLGIGEETSDKDLGPSDYSRSRQLEEIERELADPTAFVGMPMQRAADALVAAKLARGVELHRTDVEGRFLRAIRLADDGGLHRQKLVARYEALWTAVWWYDDIPSLLSGYDGFETLVLDDTQASNFELLCNLAQVLFNTVITGQMAPEQVQLEPRIRRLSSRLDALAKDTERPNNALEATTSLLVVRVNLTVLAQDRTMLASLWPQFGDVLSKAETLGEFDAARLSQLIERFGDVAGDDRGYRDLVDQLAEFTTKRTGECEGALVLLRRARRLSFNQNMEMIRLLGRAARLLSKKEHAQEHAQALAELAVAYKSAGLSWAARASATSAAVTMFVDAEDESTPPAGVFPILMNVAWMALALKYLPEALDTIQVARGCLAGLPFDEASAARASEQLQEFDLVLACQLVNLSEAELSHMPSVPDVLRGLDLPHSFSALMYRLGYEDKLREEGYIPASESADDVANIFSQMAGQPTNVALWRPAVLNGETTQTCATAVLGVRIDVSHEPTDTAIIVAEAIAGSIEAFFATAFELEAVGHVERFDVRVLESDARNFVVETDLDHMRMTVRCPPGLFPGSPGVYADFQRMLFEVATRIFWATCHTKSHGDAADRLLGTDSAADRMAMIASLCLSRNRVFGGVARLSKWDQHAPQKYELRLDRPKAIAQAPAARPVENDGTEEGTPPRVTNHDDVAVRSVIDLHLWDQAGWTGAAFGSFGGAAPPFLALMFKNQDTAAKIFERWRERFGSRDDSDEIYVGIVRQYSAEHPAHYGMVVTSRLPDDGNSRTQFSTLVSRSLSMEPDNDVNLTRFLKDYERVGAYLLMPMVLGEGQAQPALLRNMFLLKQALHVKRAADVGPSDLENLFLRPRGLGPLKR